MSTFFVVDQPLCRIEAIQVETKQVMKKSKMEALADANRHSHYTELVTLTDGSSVSLFAASCNALISNEFMHKAMYASNTAGNLQINTYASTELCPMLFQAISCFNAKTVLHRCFTEWPACQNVRHTQPTHSKTFNQNDLIPIYLYLYF